MKNYVASQALSLGISLMLGVTIAFLYDLSRTIRLRRRKNHSLTHVLDALFVLTLSLLLLWLAVVVGQGRLRLYMLLGCMGGGVLWWLFPGRLLRPVWDFWLDSLLALLRWLLLPINKCKNLFSFLPLWSIIKRKVGERRRRSRGKTQQETHRREAS